MDFDTFRALDEGFSATGLAQPLSVEDSKHIGFAYRSLTVFLSEVLEKHFPDRSFSPLIENMAYTVQQHINDRVQPGVVLPLQIPVLSQQLTDEWKNRLTSLLAQIETARRPELCAAALATFSLAIKHIWQPGSEIERPDLAPLFVAEFQSFIFWNRMRELRDSKIEFLRPNESVKKLAEIYGSRLRLVIESFKDEARQLQNISIENQNSLDLTLRSAEERMVKAAKNIADIEASSIASSKNLAQLNSEIENSKSKQEAFVTAIKEELKIDATKHLWLSQARNSSDAFWASAALIALMIIVPPWYVFTHVKTVAEFLQLIGDAATRGVPSGETMAQITAATISRLVIITAPLVLYFWAVKLVVRFNIRSLALMDDAQQRHTTMDTYFHLIESQGATTEERALMLNALFRPMPGQSGDNVEPPNFTELVGKSRND